MKKQFVIITVFMTMFFSVFTEEACIFNCYDQYGGRIYLSEIKNEGDNFTSFLIMLETKDNTSEDINYKQFITVLCSYPGDESNLRNSLLRKFESFTYAGTGMGYLLVTVDELQWDIVRNGYIFLGQQKMADYKKNNRHKILFGITQEDFEELTK